MRQTSTGPETQTETQADTPTQTQAPTQATNECPECAAPVETRPTMLGELVDCNDCGAELEAVALEPPTFAVAPDLEEDWGE